MMSALAAQPDSGQQLPKADVRVRDASADSPAPPAPEIEPIGAEYPCLAQARQAILQQRYWDAKAAIEKLDKTCAEDSVRCALMTQAMHGIGYHDALKDAAIHPERAYTAMRMYVAIRSSFAPHAAEWLRSSGGSVVIARARETCEGSGIGQRCFDHIAEIDSFGKGSESAKAVRDIVTRTQAEDRHDRPILARINQLIGARAIECWRRVSPWCRDEDYQIEQQLAERPDGRESACSSRGDTSQKVMKLRQQFELLLAELTERRRVHVEGTWRMTEERCTNGFFKLPISKWLERKIPPL
jgi:hypothetical protein